MEHFGSTRRKRQLTAQEMGAVNPDSIGVYLESASPPAAAAQLSAVCACPDCHLSLSFCMSPCHAALTLLCDVWYLRLQSHSDHFLAIVDADSQGITARNSIMSKAGTASS